MIPSTVLFNSRQSVGAALSKRPLAHLQPACNTLWSHAEIEGRLSLELRAIRGCGGGRDHIRHTFKKCINYPATSILPLTMALTKAPYHYPTNEKGATTFI